MVWEEVLKKIKGTKRFFAVKVEFKEEGNTYAVVEAYLKNEILNIENKYSSEDLDVLIQSLPKNIPIILVISGNKVITKECVSSENYKTKILFNADPNDFYWYELIQDDKVFASIVRREDVDVLMSKFESQGLSVVDFAIGPLVAYSIKPLLPENSTIETGTFALNFLNDGLKSVEKNNASKIQNSYSIAGEKIPTEYMLPFASIVNYIYPNKVIVREGNFLEKKREEFKYKKAFNTLGLIAMVCFFVFLLTSYLLLEHYQKKYMQLQVEIGEQNVAYNKLIALENDKKNKEAILNESGLVDSNFLSFYAFKITRKIPKDIALTDLHIFPPTNRIKPKDRVVFQNDLIQIKGNALSNESFTEWIKELKQQKWIANLEIVDFTNTGNINFFELELTVSFNVQ